MSNPRLIPYAGAEAACRRLVPYAGQDTLDRMTWPRPENILRAFRAGADTREIASYLWLPEAVVLKELSAAREAERRNPILDGKAS